MKFFKIRRIHLVKIIYKSGAAHEAWYLDFTIKAGGNACEWIPYKHQVMKIGFDDISAIYTLQSKYVIVWG